MIPSTSPSSSVYPIQDRKGRGFMVFISWWIYDMRIHEILVSFDGQSVEILPVSIFTSEILAILSPQVRVQASLDLRISMHLLRLYCSKFIALLLSVLKTIGWGVSLIKLKSHPPTVVSLPSLSNGNPLHVQRHGSRALPGQIPQESLTLLSNDSNRASRCHLHCLINGRSVSSQ